MVTALVNLSGDPLIFGTREAEIPTCHSTRRQWQEEQLTYLSCKHSLPRQGPLQAWGSLAVWIIVIIYPLIISTSITRENRFELVSVGQADDLSSSVL